MSCNNDLSSKELKDMNDEELQSELQKLEVGLFHIKQEQHFRKLNKENQNNDLIGRCFTYTDQLGEEVYVKVLEYCSIPPKEGFYCKKIVIDEYDYTFMYEEYDKMDFKDMEEITKETYEKSLFDLLDIIKTEFK